MPRKPKAVPLSKIEDIQASLKQKAATPKTISLEELVKSLAKPIQDMLDAGYSYEDVAEVFKGHSVELAASGIKSFHKRALASTASNNSHPESTAAVSDSNSDSDLTSVDTATNDGVSPIESDVNSDGLSADSAVELSHESKPQTTKRKKTGTKTQSQFNITDRSDL
ncbi:MULTISPECIES: hypothetical protein [unclassified Tolypothrix]|nr:MULTISPECIES: hypothetical protein [unclassified Tolypothrix]EKE96795.1 hypothetical protein FDUTEX481_06337 [Tolypothrix sp. PCC 7601]MBE9083935.1 hypothetical protein [Tolypothrix sp. LEGE 11397]UYD30967.1 hypothetical protein HGR01_39675 [Tolypothrix sp. PCC 7712]UYD38851.1 hypothetical protein HG267_40725 [Tolypothrix sp. PCC 7601]